MILASILSTPVSLFPNSDQHLFQSQASSIGKLANTLKPGGKLLIRDYGRFVDRNCTLKFDDVTDFMLFYLAARPVLMLINDYTHYFKLIRYDEAQLRFKKGSKLEENFYVRQDGTCAYYFEISELRALCESHGLEMVSGENILRQYANRQQKVSRNRVWIQAKFVKKNLSV